MPNDDSIRAFATALREYVAEYIANGSADPNAFESELRTMLDERARASGTGLAAKERIARALALARKQEAERAQAAPPSAPDDAGLANDLADDVSLGAETLTPDEPAAQRALRMTGARFVANPDHLYEAPQKSPQRRAREAMRAQREARRLARRVTDEELAEKLRRIGGSDF
ncbi:MAG TPA: hypothetical protein VJO33_04735 [Gemmatimonadaceae bacterium]|nr:hypothetical protein [Gemmatimonadaceae bacterium]